MRRQGSRLVGVGVSLVLGWSAFWAYGQTLEPGWTETEIGGAAPAGSASVDANRIWQVKGGGAGLGATDDQLHYVARSLRGDGSFTARLTLREAIRSGAAWE